MTCCLRIFRVDLKNEATFDAHRGEGNILDITRNVAEAVAETKLMNRIVTVFVSESTGALPISMNQN